MEQEDSVELLKNFENKTVTDIDFTQDMTSSMITIRFSNNETLVIAGDDFDIYFAVPKDTDFH
jgi:hypothetical protein